MPPASRATGEAMETLACDYLAGRGLSPVGRNWHGRRGELDLIMRDGTTLVFVEVRYRRSARFGGAAASVDRHKRERLARTAQEYLIAHYGTTLRPCRFDVVAIAPEGSGHRIDWYPNAFGSD